MSLTLCLFVAAIGTGNPIEAKGPPAPDFVVHELATNPNVDSTCKSFAVMDGKNPLGTLVTHTIAGADVPRLSAVARSAKAFLCEGLDEGDEIDFGLTINAKGDAWVPELGGAASVTVHVKCHRIPLENQARSSSKSAGH